MRLIHPCRKSITLDTWTREQVTSLRSIGNTASNAIYNPDERRHPPPTSSSTAERDSEMEKYIRKKYEQGAFKPGHSKVLAEPTSRNRFREALDRDLDGKGLWDRSQENRRNPELNDLVVRMEKKKTQERELPPLPVSASSTGPGPRERPRPTTTPSPAPIPVSLPLPQSRAGSTGSQAPPPALVDLSGTASNSTLPLQNQSLAPPQSAPSTFFSTSAPTLSPNNQFMLSGNSYFAPSSASTTPMHSPAALGQQNYNPFNQYTTPQPPAFQPSQPFGPGHSQQLQQQQQPMYASPYASNPFTGLSPGNTNAFAHVNGAQGFSQQLDYQQQQPPFQPGGMTGGGWQQQQQQPQMQVGWMGQSQPMHMGMGMGMGNNFAYAQSQGQ